VLLAACADGPQDSGTPDDSGSTPTVDTGPFDSDGDGVIDATDCAPEDPTVHPGATETWYDGVDQDCDGNDADWDLDGHDWEGVEGGDDCDDQDPTVYPGAPETWYDGIDQDCAGFEDEDDRDLDGWSVSEDCDDAHPHVHPSAEEWCDALDHDCDGDPLVAGVCSGIQPTERLWVMTMESEDTPNGFAFQSAQFLGDMDGDGDEELIAYCAVLYQRPYDANDDLRGLAILPGWEIPWDDPTSW